MLKKVKQKTYKSKKEFADDLDLIWNNCFTYNSGEVRISGYRLCASNVNYAATTGTPLTLVCHALAGEGEQDAEERH